MALRTVLTKEQFDNLGEELQKLYALNDVVGKYVLDLGDDDLSEHPNVTALRNAHKNSQQERNAANEKLAKLQEDFERYKDIDPDKAREALTAIQEAEDKNMIEAGEVDELLAKRMERANQDFEKQLGIKDGRITDLETENKNHMTSLSDMMIYSEVEKAAIEAKVRPSALADIKNRAKPVFSLVDNKVEARNDKGDIMYGKSGDPMTISEWVNSQNENAPHLFESSSGGGAGGSGEANTAEFAGDVKVISRSEAGGNLEAIASGEAVVSD